MTQSRRILSLSVFAAMLLLLLLSCRAAAQVPALSPVASGALSAEKIKFENGYARLPLSFEANQGQSDPQVKFLSRAGRRTLFLNSTEAILTSGDRDALHMRFVHGNRNALVVGLEKLPGNSNYFFGTDPGKWHTNIPTYAKVRYRHIYPGVDLMYYGNQRELEYDFLVAPGADPATIRMAIRGARELSMDGDGNAVVRLENDVIKLLRPHVYQELNGKRIDVDGRYTLKGQEVRFQLGAYDRRRSLVIDPVLAYATYLGGFGTDGATGIAADSAGNAYVAGTTSGFFPLSNPEQPNLGGGRDVFVSKLNSTGTTLIYSTYLGGSGEDDAFGIAVDSSGSAYVTGQTVSTDFPITAGAFQAHLVAGPDAFVTKLSPNGASLIYSTYLGGSGNDTGYGVAVDSLGNAYVAGQTQSFDFPRRGINANVQNPVLCDPQIVAGFDGFIVKIAPDGRSLVYSLFLGGSGTDSAEGVAVDSSGDAYVAGYTNSTDFLASNCPGPGPGSSSFQAQNAGGYDAFIVTVNPTGTSLLGATYLGSFLDEFGTSITVDGVGSAYVSGEGTLNNTAGGRAAFLAKLDSTLSKRFYLTYFAGAALTGTTIATGVAVDSSGNGYLSGFTTSSDLPMISPIQPTFGGGLVDAFLAEIDLLVPLLFRRTWAGVGVTRLTLAAIPWR